MAGPSRGDQAFLCRPNGIVRILPIVTSHRQAESARDGCLFAQHEHCVFNVPDTSDYERLLRLGLPTLR